MNPDKIRNVLNILFMTVSYTHLKEAQAEKERPTLIIGKTVMGKGARKADGSSYEANCATHGAPLGGDAYVNTIKNLNGDPANPFVIFPEVAEPVSYTHRDVYKRQKPSNVWVIT